jgi:hypothetical protein
MTTALLRRAGALTRGDLLEAPPGGMIEIPDRYRAFYGMTHQFAAGEQTLALTAGQINISDSLVIDSTFDFYALGRAAIWSPAASGGQGKIQLKIDRELQFAGAGGGNDSVGCYLSTIGTGRFPQYLAAPLLIRGKSTFVAIAGDFQTVAAALTLRTLHFGYIVRKDPVVTKRWYASRTPWRYMADFTVEGPLLAALGANKTQQIPVPIDPDGDFEVKKLIIVSDGEAKLQVKNADTRAEWFHRAVHVWLLGGTTIDADPPAGAWPFLLPDECPEFIAARGALSVTAQDLSGASNRMQVIFEGDKLKPAGGLRVGG